MKQIIAIVFVGLVLAEPAFGKNYLALHDPTCSHFTAFYAKSGFEIEKRPDNIYPSWTNDQFGFRFNWILGYLTYANKHEVRSGDFMADKGMGLGEVISWIGSWCRDHPRDKVSKAIDTLLSK